jgi:hypothetical protein
MTRGSVKTRQIALIPSLRIPEIESIARDDVRLQPRLRAPLRGGLRMQQYIEELAKEIIRHQRKKSRSALAEAARLFESMQFCCADDEQETEALRRLRTLHASIHQAWRRKDVDDVTMFVLARSFARAGGRGSFGKTAAFLCALEMRVDIDLAVAEWHPSGATP